MREALEGYMAEPNGTGSHPIYYWTKARLEEILPGCNVSKHGLRHTFLPEVGDWEVELVFQTVQHEPPAPTLFKPRDRYWTGQETLKPYLLQCHPFSRLSRPSSRRRPSAKRRCLPLDQNPMQ